MQCNDKPLTQLTIGYATLSSVWQYQTGVRGRTSMCGLRKGHRALRDSGANLLRDLCALSGLEKNTWDNFVSLFLGGSKYPSNKSYSDNEHPPTNRLDRVARHAVHRNVHHDIQEETAKADEKCRTEHKNFLFFRETSTSHSVW